MLQVLFLSWILVGEVLGSGPDSTGNPCLLSISGVQCKTVNTKDGQTVQLIHKLVPLDVVERMYQPAHINTTWKCVKPACLSSPCMYGGNCTETDDGFECECPEGFGGQRCEIYPPRNCAELKERDGITEDGMYVIDPDGEHRNLSFPVEMECLMADGITNVPHDITAQETTPPYMGVGEFMRNVTYPFDSDTILALIQNSKSCKQNIFARAYRSYIYSSDGLTHNVWWVSRQGRKMPNWGDTPSDHQGCECSYITPTSPSNTCPAGRLCQSDYSYISQWYQDEGYLTDINRLPVIRLHTGFTTQSPGSTSRHLYYNLGPLQCEGYWSY